MSTQETAKMAGTCQNGRASGWICVACGQGIPGSGVCYVNGTPYHPECVKAGTPLEHKEVTRPRPGCLVKCHLEAGGPALYTVTRVLGPNTYQVVKQPSPPPTWDISGDQIIEVLP